MAEYLRMPGVSADADEAVLSEWNVSTGDELAAGATVASVETDKAVVDIDVPQESVVFELLVDNGATVAVGDPIAVLIKVGEDLATARQLVDDVRGHVESAQPATEPELVTDATPVSAEAAAAAQAPEGSTPTATTSGGRLRTSPLVRRLAGEHDIDLTTITGTGPGGRIVKKDILPVIAAKSEPAASQAAEPAPASPQDAAPVTATSAVTVSDLDGEYTITPHSRIRSLVARRLQQSKATAPHFYLRREIRVDALLELRKQINESSAVRISVNDLFVKAAAKALVEVPEVNVVWSDEGLIQFTQANVAVAVASDRGLMTPVVRRADVIGLAELSRSIKDLASRAGEGKLQQSELEGGAFTVSNLGMFGIDDFDAIINPPHVGILAIGAARKVPVFEGDQVVPAHVVTVSVSVDHRAVDGALAATWLGTLHDLIASPLQILT